MTPTILFTCVSLFHIISILSFIMYELIIVNLKIHITVAHIVLWCTIYHSDNNKTFLFVQINYCYIIYLFTLDVAVKSSFNPSL